MNTRIAYTKPSITALEVGYATDAAQNGWGEHCYDYIKKFEAAFAQHIGSKHALATSSCTGALHMGMAALGIGQGDEVILADTNWIATVAPIVHLGATPVFVDIDEQNWCLAPDLVERAITPRTKAIVAVHLYGNLCELDQLSKIAEKHGLFLIEDAAEAIGSVYHGRRAGSIGNFGAYSFHGTKTITTGEGGIFVTNDSELHERVLTLSNHGRARNQTKQFWPDMIGFKYKMSNIQAAIGLGQIERVEDLISRKRQIMQGYRDRVKNINCISLNYEGLNTINGAWMPTAVFDPEANVTSEMLTKAFDESNIDARVFFHPLSTLPFFPDQVQNEKARSVANRAINLPSFHDMTDDDQDRVTQVLFDIANHA